MIKTWLDVKCIVEDIFLLSVYSGLHVVMKILLFCFRICMNINNRINPALHTMIDLVDLDQID